MAFALERLQVFTHLAEAKSLNIADYCAENGLDESVFRALIASAESFGFMSVRGDQVELTQDGQEVRRMIGFFTWSVGGYHDVFANAAPIARGKRSFGEDVRRDEAMVALGSAQADIALMRHLLDEQINQLDFSVLADLGSGISERLCRLIQTRPGTRGIGLDISQSATELAVETVSRYDLQGQVKPVCADVRDVISGKQKIEGADEVDVVMSFMFLHDLLIDPATRSEVIPSLRAAFPKAHTFLLGDTTVRPHDGSGTMPIFSSGFELAHALMGVPIYTREAYEELFEQGGLTVRRTVPFGAPHTYLFVLEAR
ncbi:SAM-dependent methyltransferase [Streptomyces sp. G5(2025)]|uniref:SAM-dependent methyltransferase n=1 Tax=Streptomyces sp. G5(2025) TaxID=3406628 RepID=UPI003C18739D